MSKQSKSGISWTQETLNVVTGCTPVHEGCKNCYAARYANRGIGDFKKGPQGWMGTELRKRRFDEVRIHPKRLERPLHWDKSRRIFSCSMGDLFHDQVPDEFIDHYFAVMALCWPRHNFQILTKRPDRALKYLTWHDDIANGRRERVLGLAWTMLGQMPKYKHNDICNRLWPLPNVWLGYSTSTQKDTDWGLRLLLQTPAAVRFVSAEPLLSGIDFKPYLPRDCAELR